MLSSTAAELVRDFLPDGASLRDLGEHRLKDLGRPEQIFQLRAAGMLGEFPPLRSLDNPDLPNNLPAQLASFVGREPELGDVRSLVDGNRLVTLSGAGGTGKTRLALQVAAEMLDGSGEGASLVELASVSDEDAVASTIMDALGIARRSDLASIDNLIESLVSQRALILFDNCEHLIGGCAKVAEAVLRRCPHIYLLATSREPLDIAGETIYRVPSLLSAEAIACNDRSGDVFNTALLHNNGGVYRLRYGDLEAAGRHLESAREAMAAMGQVQGIVACNSGWVLREAGDVEAAMSELELSFRLSRRSGNANDIAYAALGLACVSGDVADRRKSAQLHGFADAKLARTGEPWQNPEDGYRQRSLDRARAELGDDDFERAYAEGSTMDDKTASDLALGRI